MIIPLMVATLMCPTTVNVVNETKLPFNKFDQKMLADAIATNPCRNYSLDDQCLYVFKKVGRADYHVTCGPKVIIGEK